ncbi:MAG: THUMP domain-containing protein [Candidatus Woesearchaeota archaeon]
MDCVICRYGELALKGKNRGLFEDKLLHNMKDCLKKNAIDARVEKVRGRIFVHTSDESALDCLKRVFGLVSLSPADITESDEQKITEKVIEYVSKLDVSKIKTFRITTKRTNKKFSKTSGETDILLGDTVNEKFGFSVDLTSPDLNIGIEIHDKTYIFHEKKACFGGLPLGITGKVACLIRNSADVAAAWLVMRRGCEALLLLMGDEKYTILDQYSYGANIKTESIGDLSFAKEIINSNKCKALVVGDSLDGFDQENYAVTGVAVLAPLIIYTESQISDLLEKIR